MKNKLKKESFACFIIILGVTCWRDPVVSRKQAGWSGNWPSYCSCVGSLCTSVYGRGQNLQARLVHSDIEYKKLHNRFGFVFSYLMSCGWGVFFLAIHLNLVWHITNKFVTVFSLFSLFVHVYTNLKYAIRVHPVSKRN